MLDYVIASMSTVNGGVTALHATGKWLLLVLTVAGILALILVIMLVELAKILDGMNLTAISNAHTAMRGGTKLTCSTPIKKDLTKNMESVQPKDLELKERKLINPRGRSWDL